MNLELIKKYEKEFLHMLHGGKLMFKPNDKQVWFDSVTSPIDWTVEGLYVIDDEYCIYRIALAEEKTVEVYVLHGVKALDEQPWRRFAIGCSTFDLPVECYRIKPEEPEFKIGDYVRYIHANSPKPLRIVNINCERYYFENAEIILRIDEIEKWEPREGEICIFWDAVDTGAIISKFSYMEQEKYGTDLYTWNNCMPFTGTLPPHMKDN